MNEIKYTDGRDAAGVVIENQITEVKLSYLHAEWKIEVTKEFSPQFGGGSQVFSLSGGPSIHEALRRAAEMVTVTPSYNRQEPTVWCARCDTHHRTSELPGVCPVERGIEISEKKIAEVGPVIASIEAEYCALCKRSLDRETEVFVEDGDVILHQHCAHELWEASDPPMSHDYDSEGNPRRGYSDENS